MNDQFTPAYAFGCNELTASLAKFYPLLAIIDDFTEQEILLDLPVVRLHSVDKNAVIINCVYNSRAYFAQEKLLRLGFNKIQFIGSLIALFPEKFLGTMLGDAYKGIQSNLLSQKHLFNDAQSRQEFEAILNFRHTLDIRYLASFEVKIYEQYFESFVEQQSYQCLIDGGAYDGSDSKKFAQIFPNYRSISVIEPSKDNRQLINEKLTGLRSTEIIAACLGKEAGVVYFEGQGTDAKIVTSGGVPVDVITIDELVGEAKTLVKLDIEGAEMAALAGAERALENPNVGFAISAYHLPHDLMDILQWLNASSVKRELYFRHYSNGIAESIIFAL